MKQIFQDGWALFILPYQILFKAIKDSIKIVADYEKTLFNLKSIIKATDIIAKDLYVLDLYSGDYIDTVEWANWKTGECQLLATNSNGSLLINPYTSEPTRFKTFLNFVLVYKGDDIEDYQNTCRFYLDDYKEQEEIRKEWFDINHPKALYIYSSQFVSYLDKLILNGLGFKLIFNKNPYDHFHNRFMRKN